MATNLLQAKTFAQKKSVCIAAADVVEGTERGQVPATSGDYKIFNLPENATITGASIFVKSVSDAATTAVATLGTTEGGTEILSAGDLKTAGAQGTFTGESDTGTGTPVFLGIDYTGAATAVGSYVVRIEYVEYTLNTGMYTSLID